MKLKEILASFPRKDKLRKRLANNRRKLKRLCKTVEKDTDIVNSLYSINCWYKDYPLQSSNENTHYPSYRAIDEENHRIAELFLNAHNDKTWVFI